MSPYSDGNKYNMFSNRHVHYFRPSGSSYEWHMEPKDVLNALDRLLLLDLLCQHDHALVFSYLRDQLAHTGLSPS